MERLVPEQVITAAAAQVAFDKLIRPRCSTLDGSLGMMEIV
jgi:hypothetical protein